MKKQILMASVLAFGWLAPVQAEDGDAIKLENDNEKASYSVGLKYGEGLRRDLDDLDLDTFILGIRHAFTEKKPLMEEEEIRKVITDYRTKRMQVQREKAQKLATQNKDEGDKFLAANKSKDGVKVTESGLQYQVIKEGSGDKPGLNSTVKVHYHGTLIDGSVFDSSVERGEPISFPVNGVIKGWTEALQMMAVGSKWKLYIPSDLAYGERSPSPNIGPNSTLIFEVELLGVES